jgi:glycosyltransferase involved in cell wall biosynthesis
MDPRFGGGQRSFTAAFWSAALELGHDPRLLYVSRERGLSPRMRGPRLAVAHEEQPPFQGDAVPSFLPEGDAVNQLVAGERIARRIRNAPFAWVVAAGAPYGWGAARSGRPYGCWLATQTTDEFRSRREALSPSRRAALALNQPLLERMERTVIRRARYVATISPRSRELLADAAGLDPASIAVWPVPVDLGAFVPLADDDWEARLERPTIVFVGRGSDPRKNVSLLADAFPAIRERVPGARLRFAGEPPPDAVLRRAGKGAEAVGEIGSMPDAIRDAALLVLPSKQEGLGIVVAEAFACGVPAVVTPSGGPEHLVRDSEAGVVLEGWEPDELAAVVVALLEDRPRLLALRRRARAYAEREHSPQRLRELLAGALAELTR